MPYVGRNCVPGEGTFLGYSWRTKTPEDANSYSTRAIDSVREGRYDSASDDYNDALSIKGTDPILYYNRGVAYMNKGDYENAVRDFTRAIELQPDSVIAYNNRAVVYKNRGENDRAIAEMK